MTKLKGYLFNEKWLKFIFIAWLLTLPFEAKILSYSFSSFTIYPNLFFTLLLGAYIPLTIVKWHRIKIITFTSVLLLLFSALFWIVSNGTNVDAIFDLRSLILFMLTVGGFFSIHHLLAKEQFLETLKQGLIFGLILISAFGIFEWISGIHFSGNYTDDLINQRVGNNHYTALFVYDNPNNYLVHLFIYAFSLILVWPEFRKNTKMLIIVFIIILILSIQAYARIMIMLSVLGIIIEGFVLLKKANLKKSLKFGLAGIVGILLLVAGNSLFLGPKHDLDLKNQFILNNYNVILDDGESFKNVKTEDLTYEEKKKLFYMYFEEKFSSKTSFNVRKNLTQNGIDFIKERPVLGVGPGQYRTRHSNGEVNRPTSTNRSAHNFVIELISQYGIFAWIFFCVLVFLMILSLKKKAFFENRYLLLSIPFFFILGLVPSSFLNLYVMWILVAIITVMIVNKSLTYSEDNER
jgi:hypothetical protein